MLSVPIFVNCWCPSCASHCRTASHIRSRHLPQTDRRPSRLLLGLDCVGRRDERMGDSAPEWELWTTMICICRPRIKVVCSPHHPSDKGWVAPSISANQRWSKRFSTAFSVLPAASRICNSGHVPRSIRTCKRSLRLDLTSWIQESPRVVRNMTSTAVSSATPTLVTQQLTFLPPALLTPSVEYQQTPRPESAQPPMADQPPARVHHGEPSIHITFLLLSGKRKTVGFDPEYTIGKVRQEVFDDWPEGGRFNLHKSSHNSVTFIL
jgi:hypothetical protein